MDTILHLLAQELRQPEKYVENVAKLLDEGNTVPFIARYRKEMHGSMDDQTIRQLGRPSGVSARAGCAPDGGAGGYCRAGEADGRAFRRHRLCRDAGGDRRPIPPYRPKRRTRASVAREKGLEPLAQLLRNTRGNAVPAARAAEAFVSAGKGVDTADDALAGARDILAEELSDDAEVRKRLRGR